MASKKNDVGRVASLRYWQAEDARAVVEAWKESGDRLSAFARRHGIKPRRLSQWATRLEAASEAISFHPVQVVEAPPRERAQRDPIEIVLGEGYSVRVPPCYVARPELASQEVTELPAHHQGMEAAAVIVAVVGAAGLVAVDLDGQGAQVQGDLVLWAPAAQAGPVGWQPREWPLMLRVGPANSAMREGPVNGASLGASARINWRPSHSRLPFHIGIGVLWLALDAEDQLGVTLHGGIVL